MFLLFMILAQTRLESVLSWDLEDHEIFEYYTSFDVADGDLLAVIDIQTPQLLLIDAQGEVKHRCGKRGKGPGELLDPRLVQYMPKQRAFALYDHGNRRISFWNTDGQLLAETHMSVNLGNDAELLDKDHLLYTWKSYGQQDQNPTLVSFHISAKKAAPFWTHELKKPMKFNAVTFEQGSGTVILPWDWRMVFAVGPEFIAVTFPATENIDLLDKQGKKLVSFAPRLPRFPITPQQIDEAIEGRPSKETRAWMQTNRGSMIKPESWAAVAALRIDEQNRIWVFGSKKSPMSYHPVNVLNRKGELKKEYEIKSLPRRSHGRAHYYIHVKPDTNLVLEKVVF